MTYCHSQCKASFKCPKGPRGPRGPQGPDGDGILEQVDGVVVPPVVVVGTTFIPIATVTLNNVQATDRILLLASFDWGSLSGASTEPSFQIIRSDGLTYTINDSNTGTNTNGVMTSFPFLDLNPLVGTVSYTLFVATDAGFIGSINDATLTASRFSV